MTILHIGYTYGTNYTGGAAIAATRLHNYLLDAGVESHFLCVCKTEDGRNVIEWPPQGSLWRKLRQFLAKIERNIWRFTPYRSKIDLNVIPLGIKSFVRRLKPDIVQVHNVGNGMFRFEELLGLGIPVILTQHDFWKTNGFDPYPYSDSRIFTGFDRTNSTLLERWMWRRKYRLSRESCVSYVAPSAWAAEMTRRSKCGEGKRVDVIPYFIGPGFKYDPAKRGRHDKFRIVFGCNCGMKNEFKGFDDLAAAVAMLPSEVQRETELHVFGDVAPDFKIGETEVKVRGIMHNVDELVAMYHSGDIFAFPSKTETQGMVKIEAMLCGLPVVAFDRTACPESIDHGVNGWIAPGGDRKSFANGIVHFFKQWKNGELDEARQKIHDDIYKKYSNETILNTALAVYGELLRKVV